MLICNACRLSWKDSTAQRKYVEAVVVGTRAIDVPPDICRTKYEARRGLFSSVRRTYTCFY